MTDVTDEMVSAALRVWETPQEDERLHPSQHFRRAIAAALAAAPAAGGSVWCEHFHDVVLTLHGTGCPGPHRSLLLGPEVTA